MDPSHLDHAVAPLAHGDEVLRSVRLQEVADLLVVDLQVAARSLPLDLLRVLLEVGEAVADHLRRDALVGHGLHRAGLAGAHGVGLAAAGLAVGHEAHVLPIHGVREDSASDVATDLLLRCRPSEGSIREELKALRCTRACDRHFLLVADPHAARPVVERSSPDHDPNPFAVEPLHLQVRFQSGLQTSLLTQQASQSRVKENADPPESRQAGDRSEGSYLGNHSPRHVEVEEFDAPGQLVRRGRGGGSSQYS
mmetsp:Transcript_78302/g.203522  ORF Transcript_78302/g.203522 Transcript_78302/m.203522 type:complete len:252 (-) Transcript_78302:8-763(-)